MASLAYGEYAANFFPDWRKSSRSMGNGNCLEVAELPGNVVGVRDSKNPRGAVLRFAPAEWDNFLEGIRNDSERQIYTNYFSG